MIPAVYAPTYVYGWQIEPWHVWITIICACLLVLSAWLHGVSWQARHHEPDDHPLLDVAPQARPDHLPDKAKVAARMRAHDWRWRPDPGVTTDEAERQVPLQVAYKSRSETRWPSIDSMH